MTQIERDRGKLGPVKQNLLFIIFPKTTQLKHATLTWGRREEVKRAKYQTPNEERRYCKTIYLSVTGR